jgi:catechol 2,3-dioxygenase-like lactoylglutathione lyase family enzyme
MKGVARILPSRDLSATAAFYSQLGFEYVEDADALFADFSAIGLPSAGIPRLQGPVEATDYGLREFAVVDPDGNLLRIGSFVADPR